MYIFLHAGNYSSRFIYEYSVGTLDGALMRRIHKAGH